MPCRERYAERRSNPSLGPGFRLYGGLKLRRSNQSRGNRNALSAGSLASPSEMTEIVIVIFFSKEVWLLIIGPGREKSKQQVQSRSQEQRGEE